MTSNTIKKLSAPVNFVNDKTIFQKGENSFKGGYILSYNFSFDIGAFFVVDKLILARKTNFIKFTNKNNITNN